MTKAIKATKPQATPAPAATLIAPPEPKLSRNGVPGNLRRMQRRRFDAVVSPRSIEELLRKLEKHLEGETKELYPWATRFALGLPLAPWQRDFKWSVEQQVRFIESLWSDLDVGSYLINDVIGYETIPGSGDCSYRYLSDIVLDGQQRLTAIENYVMSKFPVADVDGVPVYWHELSIIEQRFFGSKTFSRATVRMKEEAEMRELYNLRSFGGTAHEEHERA